MNGPLKAAWGLTAFVVLAGLVLWLVTGRAVFAVFIVLGVLTGLGAWLTGRAGTAPGRPASKEDTIP
jgi:dolichol kinase